MAQYLLSVWHEGDYPDPGPAELEQLVTQVDAFNAELTGSGRWVFGGGLHPASTATVVTGRGTDDPVLVDGPFAETKEQMGGFWVIRAADLDEALDWARRASDACMGPVEVRPFADEVDA
jgi:hypothetical protein